MQKLCAILFSFLDLLTSSCKQDITSRIIFSTRMEVMVVSEQDSTGTFQLFIRDKYGSNPKQITFNNLKSSMPSIAPDGVHIAYVMEGNGFADIYLVRFDGTDNLKITSSGVNVTPCWTITGDHILFASAKTPYDNFKIFSMQPDGTEKSLLIRDTCNCSELVPTCSPDGQFLAFESNRSGIRKQEIWRVHLDGTHLTRLTTIGYDSEIKANIQQKVPAWSPNGKNIALWQGVEMDELHHDGSIRDAKIIQSWKVWVMDMDGTKLRSIDQGDDPSWSNDSKYILHPDPMHSLNNNNNQISINKSLSDGTDNTMLFKTFRNFGRMAIGFRN